jgi:hypothetical protein
LHGHRIDADYRLDVKEVESEEFAVLRKEDASDILAAISSLRQAKSHPQGKARYESIAAGAKAWAVLLRDGKEKP